MSGAFSAAALLALLALPAQAATLTIDGDTAATGLTLSTGNWLSPLGTVTFGAEFGNGCPDDELVTAGASGNCVDIDGSATATMTFDFDVESITFIYGGNSGGIDISAFDVGAVLVDSFFQASTGIGEPAGPVTLSGGGIRSLFWQDPGKSFAAIDNITITTADVPVPAALPLLAGALGLLGFMRRRG
jgi:hypothetical protein